MDVGEAIILESSYSMEKILLDAPDSASKRYYLTPLDFVNRDEWIVSVIWVYHIEIFKKLKLVFVPPKGRPITHLSSFKFFRLSSFDMILCIVFTVVYASIFIAAWNAPFPSPAERTLWRVTTVTTLAISAICGSFETFFSPIGSRMLEKKGKGTPLTDMTSNTLPGPVGSEKFRGKVALFVKRLRNSSPDKDPALNVPGRSFLSTLPIGATYALCRMFILFEDVIGLRELPASAFQQVEWSKYLPNF